MENPWVCCNSNNIKGIDLNFGYYQVLSLTVHKNHILHVTSRLLVQYKLLNTTSSKNSVCWIMFNSEKCFQYKHIYGNNHNYNNLGDTYSSVKTATGLLAWVTPESNISQASTSGTYKIRVFELRRAKFPSFKILIKIYIVYKVKEESGILHHKWKVLSSISGGKSHVCDATALCRIPKVWNSCWHPRAAWEMDYKMGGKRN